MAVVIDPQEAINNLRILEREGVRGEFGFFEAVDYTPERLGAEEKNHIIKSFLAHHQGMSLISINNLLNKNIFQERFHSNPNVKANEILLQERFPTRIPVIQPHQAEVLSLKTVDSDSKVGSVEVVDTPHTRYPKTRLLSNGNFSILVDNAGSGVSFYKSDITLNRWREDALSNSYGSYIYIKDLKQEGYWSTAYQPTKVEAESYEAIFSFDKIEFKRRDRDLAIHTEITVSPEDNVDVRRVTITNLSDRLRELEFTSFGEVALTGARADLAHPAFSKLFIRTEYLEDYNALIFERRPRSDHDQTLFMMHQVIMPVVWDPTQYETCRDNFIGRGGSAMYPEAMVKNAKLSSTVGTVLDPIYALRNKIEVSEGNTFTFCLVTGIAESREELLHLVKKYHEMQAVTRAFEMAWSHSNVEIRHQHISRADINNFQKLANAILFNVESLRAPQEVSKKNKLSQSGLWRFGVSGDEPIVLLIINDKSQLKICEELLFAHEYLRLRGLRFDLVILNEFQSGYLQELQEELEFVIRAGYSRHLVDQRGGIFLRSLNQLSEEEIVLLQSSARVIIYGNKGILSSQLVLPEVGVNEIAKKVEVKHQTRKFSDITNKLLINRDLDFYNGIGGFSKTNQAYVMDINRENLPPLPWVNVVASKDFGFLVSETGAGFTWADNSRENRLSNWSNDPLIDPCSEVIYLRDTESGDFWNTTLSPVINEYNVKVEHGFGYSSFTSEKNKIKTKQTLSISQEDRVKWYFLEISNQDKKDRKLELYFYFDWVLGVARQDSYRYLRTGFEQEKQFLYAFNPFNIDFPQQIVFAGANVAISSYTTNRTEFIGRNRDASSPIIFDMQRHLLRGLKAPNVILSGTTGYGYDSSCIMKVQIEIPAGVTEHVMFYLAKEETLEKARAKSSEYRLINSRTKEFDKSVQYWQEQTSVIEIETPSKSFDIMLNGWLLYQTLACRILARSGFYQSSGAIGFRDQLQDSMALLLCNPQFTKDQILLHASRQFPEGDVQHWWHPPSGKGIRTKITDNYMWLPFAVAQYIQVTGDKSILNEQVSFIEGPELEPGKFDLYFTPQVSEKRASLYEHCILCLDRAMSFGPHGLPLMGSGDWNDGMNLVGIEGKGESVWLGWFMLYIYDHFIPILQAQGDQYRVDKYNQVIKTLTDSIEENAWDGKWYRRAYFDDGSPMGSAQNEECKIDSLAQSWGVISGYASPERQKESMENLYKYLVDKDNRIVKLLTPAFEESKPNPGYIQSYPAGLRENGGQYTHGATWAVMAFAIAGDGDKAFELFDLINPITHTDKPEILNKYKTEPYVTCGDVYSNAQHPGRGGWSWYTGSSGWLYRAAVEYILGVKVHGDYFTVYPAIPKDWDNVKITYRRAGTFFEVTILNKKKVSTGVDHIKANGEVVEDKKIVFEKYSGKVVVEVVMG
ncbi:MAG: hypothetical protein KBC84_08625 [Proteobacteria bacterium]|nr:hypothetical protein [Pseudomonadota bacterium]